MTKIRTRFSRKSKYYISRGAFLSAYGFSLTYNDLKREHDTLVGLTRGNGDGGEGSGGIGDPTASQAIRLADLAEKINLIEQTAYDTDPPLHPYLLMYVTNEHMTFETVKALGIPCERTMFYDRRRKYYWLLSVRMGLHSSS